MKLMVPMIEKSCDTLVEKLNKIADSGELYDNFLPSGQKLNSSLCNIRALLFVLVCFLAIRAVILR